MTPGIFLGDRWLLARLGQKYQCVSSPWPATFIRLHAQNGYMGATGEAKVAAHRQCGEMILSVCRSEGIDVRAFWEAYKRGSIENLPEVVRQGIYDCYPEFLRKQLLGGWKPHNGLLSRIGVPAFLQPPIRKTLRLIQGQ